eukprot:255708-Pleurochrysis_carterae.AAC.1
MPSAIPTMSKTKARAVRPRHSPSRVPDPDPCVVCARPRVRVARSRRVAPARADCVRGLLRTRGGLVPLVVARAVRASACCLRSLACVHGVRVR